MINDNDIAQALKQSSEKPSQAWKDSTLVHLRAVANQKHVTDTGRMRIRLRHIFPPYRMNSIVMKAIGSLAAVAVMVVGTHGVADDATPDNGFLYPIDRAFERGEIAFAKLGGRVAVAHRHLAHARERTTEINALLRSDAATEVSWTTWLIPTVSAQEVQADTTADARVQLLMRDYRDALQTAVRILEEIAEDSASRVPVEAQADLAVAIEATAKAAGRILQTDVNTSADTDTTQRDTLQAAIETSNEAAQHAQNMRATIRVRAEQAGKIIICHRGKTMSIAASAWKAHQQHGDTEGACGEEQPTDADEDEDEEVDTDEQEETSEDEASDAAASASGQIKVVTEITICHRGNTIRIASPAWPAHQQHGDTEGACTEDADETDDSDDDDDESAEKETDDDEEESTVDDDDEEREEEQSGSGAEVEAEVETNVEIEAEVKGRGNGNGVNINTKARGRGNASVRLNQ